MFKKKIFALSLLLATSPLFSQDSLNLQFYSLDDEDHLPYLTFDDDDMQMPEKTETSYWEPKYRMHRVGLRHREANGIGYSHGYSTLELFTSHQFDNFTPFIDLRAHMFNNGKWAANAGLGLRHYCDEASMIFGVNAYYDYKQARHKSFHQIGAGLEALGECWDFRLNGSFPTKTKKRTSNTRFTGFKRHRAYFGRDYELAFTGGELEVGRFLVRTSIYDLHATMGVYYFHAPFGKQAAGGLFRLNGHISPYFSYEGQVSYDSRFHWVGQGEVTVSVPFGPRHKIHSTCAESLVKALEDRLGEPVSRFEMIVTSKHKKKRKARDTVTDEPLFFVFVDNENGSSNGTIERPYETLAEAQANSKSGDVIYVFSGDGTSNGMSNGITLQDNQRFLGSGVEHTFASAFGPVTLPAQTAVLPKIAQTTALGTVVTLANNNEVRGFDITLASGNGALGINGISKNNVSITRNRSSGGVGASSRDISLTSMNGNINISNNEMFSDIGLFVSGTGSFTATIDHNSFSTDIRGIQFNCSGGTSAALVLSNFINTAGIGIECQTSLTASINATIQNNSITGIAVSGFGINIHNHDTSQIITLIRRNSIVGTGTGAAIFFNAGDFSGPSTIIAEVAENTASGIGFFAQSAATASFLTLRLYENFMPTYGFANLGSTFTIDSANLAATGVGIPLKNLGGPITAGSFTGPFTFTLFFLDHIAP